MRIAGFKSGIVHSNDEGRLIWFRITEPDNEGDYPLLFNRVFVYQGPPSGYGYTPPWPNTPLDNYARIFPVGAEVQIWLHVCPYCTDAFVHPGHGCSGSHWCACPMACNGHPTLKIQPGEFPGYGL